MVDSIRLEPVVYRKRVRVRKKIRKVHGIKEEWVSEILVYGVVGEGGKGRS